MTMTADQQIKDFRLRRLLNDEGASTFVADLLKRGRNVLLTPTWIAQAQKAYSQKMLMTVERETLWPMAKQLMADLLSALADEDARVWAGTALALLDEEAGVDAVAQRVRAVLRDPASTPRGHYEEGMHGYFQGLQFLIKSVFDVKLNPLWCESITHFIFPWPALSAILEALRSHPDLRQRWEDLHRFYTVATGEPDCVCIHHLLDLSDGQPATVSTLAEELGVPKINRKMGIGVQGLAERFTRHSLIFEHLKETLAPLVGRLKRDPNITTDAYRHWDDDPEERYFLQWCTALASFTAHLSDGAQVQCGELLFAEGWNDTIVPGRKEPLTNSVWRDTLGKMTLKDLKDWTMALGVL